jgi:S1-C subfamily serine protease
VPRRLAVAAGIADKFGAMITAIEDGSPAASAGLKPRDIVIGLDGEAVTGIDDLIRLLNGERIERALAVSALRGAEVTTFQVTPVERQDSRKKR